MGVTSYPTKSKRLRPMCRYVVKFHPTLFDWVKSEHSRPFEEFFFGKDNQVEGRRKDREREDTHFAQ